MSLTTMEHKREARALPPPDDWPDGEAGAVWREDLMCGLVAVVAVLPEHQVRLMLAAGSCTDMAGAISLARDIDPRVRSVVTFSGAEMDVAYLLTPGGNWEARSAIPPAAKGAAR